MNDKRQDKILSAYERKSLHDSFYDLITFLEIYIEKVDYYPDLQKRGQINDKWTGWGKVWKDENPEEIKGRAMTNLFGLKVMLKVNSEKDGFLEAREELKKEFYQWIDATKINAENCPQALKNILFDFHEILEGRGEEFRKKLVEESRKETEKWSKEKWEEEMNKGFSAVYENMENEKKEEQSLDGKQWNEITLPSKFNGDAKQGKQTFMKIIGKENSNSSSKEEQERASRQHFSRQEFTWKTASLISLPIILLGVIVIAIAMKNRKINKPQT